MFLRIARFFLAVPRDGVLDPRSYFSALPAHHRRHCQATNQVRVHVSSIYRSAARDGFFVGVNITNQIEAIVDLELPSGGVVKVSEKYFIDVMIAEARFFSEVLQHELNATAGLHGHYRISAPTRTSILAYDAVFIDLSKQHPHAVQHG